MRDDEIDVIDADQDDKKVIKEAEIRNYVHNVVEYQVLYYPAYSGKGQQDIE